MFTTCYIDNSTGNKQNKASLFFQPRLTINQPIDKYEQEADAVADRVLRMPKSPLKQNTFFKPVISSIQRKCAHCEEEEKQQQLQRKETNNGEATANNELNTYVSNLSGGQPLAKEVRSFFEPSMGFDFSNVKVYTDTTAAESAQSINALAYTSGNNIVFNSGQYSPNTDSGKRLLGHELTHVIQQNTSPSNLVQRTLRVENSNTALPGMPAKQHWEDVRDLITTLSSGFDVSSSGVVAPVSPGNCTTPAHTVDNCLCDMHNSANDWKIEIKDDDWPHTDEVNQRVTIQSSRSQVEFGAWGGGAQSGTRVGQQLWRILEHELCGHAWLMERGIHPASSIVTVGGRVMSRPSHDPTVAVENQIAQDVLGPSAAQRGISTDLHSGESFGKVTISDFPTNSAHISALPGAMQARIDIVEQFMRSNPLVKADIVGHTDASGTSSVNASISRARAERIKRELISRGIASNRFNVVTGVGATGCTTPGPTADPSCRSVEVFMYIFERSSLRFP